MARFKSTITDKGAEILTRFTAEGRQLTLTHARSATAWPKSARTR
jgi:hypothetical protein